MYFPLHDPVCSRDNTEELSDCCQAQREGADEQKAQRRQPRHSAVTALPAAMLAPGLQASVCSVLARVRGVPQALWHGAFAFPLCSPVTGLLQAFALWTEGRYGLSSAELMHGKDH